MEPLAWRKGVGGRVPVDDLHPFAGTASEHDANGSLAREERVKAAGHAVGLFGITFSRHLNSGPSASDIRTAPSTHHPKEPIQSVSVAASIARDLPSARNTDAPMSQATWLNQWLAASNRNHVHCSANAATS